MWNVQKSETDSDEYVYHVTSLKNRTRPAVGEYIREKQIADLIGTGVDVNVSPIK